MNGCVCVHSCYFELFWALQSSVCAVSTTLGRSLEIGNRLSAADPAGVQVHDCVQVLFLIARQTRKIKDNGIKITAKEATVNRWVAQYRKR